VAFNQLGIFFIAANAGPMQVAYWLDDAQSDFGAQWAMAHPELNKGSFPQSGLAVLAVGNFLKTSHYDGNAGVFRYTYNVDVTNEGAIPVLFSLQGGGNV